MLREHKCMSQCMILHSLHTWTLYYCFDFPNSNILLNIKKRENIDVIMPQIVQCDFGFWCLDKKFKLDIALYFFMCISIYRDIYEAWSALSLAWSRCNVKWLEGLKRSEKDNMEHLIDRNMWSIKVVLEQLWSIDLKQPSWQLDDLRSIDIKEDCMWQIKRL